MGQIPGIRRGGGKVPGVSAQWICSLIANLYKTLMSNFPDSPQSNYGDPGTLLVDGCWQADGSRRRGHRLGIEEEKWWGGACQVRVRRAERRWGRVAGELGEDEELEEDERERMNLGFASVLQHRHPTPTFQSPFSQS